MKNLRSGKAAILGDNEYSKIRRQIKTQKYKILLDLAWYTGERWGALVKLNISDVYCDGEPMSYITFRSTTRKKRADGKADTRQVPTHPNLLSSLKSYSPPDNTSFLFPNRDGSAPITWRNAYQLFMSAVDRAGLSALGVSTHSTRRSFITKLHNNGVATATIKKITGHRDYKSLDSYIDISGDEIKGAIFGL
jgi:integrase/recombinase XerD